MHDDLRRSLGNIVGDLWGTPSSVTVPTAAETPVQDEKPVFPPFEQLWKAVDETVDWTEVLAHDTPTDGLTSDTDWALYRQHAAQVLTGSPEAYLAVLKAMDPLKDLTPWADKFDVVCRDADSLHVTFTATPALWEAEGQRYLAGMSLRIARDLFALLPILKVSITVLIGEKQLLNVILTRQMLQKVRFSFIDPADFLRQCGAAFSD